MGALADGRVSGAMEPAMEQHLFAVQKLLAGQLQVQYTAKGGLAAGPHVLE